MMREFFCLASVLLLFSCSAELKRSGVNTGGTITPPDPTPSSLDFRMMFLNTTTGEMWKRENGVNSLVVASSTIEAHTEVVSNMTTTSAGIPMGIFLMEIDNATKWSLNFAEIDGTISRVREFDYGDGDTGNSTYQPQLMGQIGEYHFFAVKTQAEGFEIWKSDGTLAGTQIVKDIVLGAGDAVLSGSYSAAQFNSKIYFKADGGTGTGRELWVTDGTEIGTFEVEDINSGAGTSDIYSMQIVGNYLSFNADDGSGRSMYFMDTSHNLTKIAGISSYGGPHFYDGKLYVTYFNSGDSTYYPAVVTQSSGHAETLSSYGVLGSGDVVFMGKIGSYVYFMRRDSVTKNVTIYKTQGTDGTTTVAENLITDNSADNNPDSTFATLSTGIVSCHDFTNDAVTNPQCHLFDGTNSTNITASFSSRVPGGLTAPQIMSSGTTGINVLKDNSSIMVFIMDGSFVHWFSTGGTDGTTTYDGGYDQSLATSNMDIVLNFYGPVYSRYYGDLDWSQAFGSDTPNGLMSFIGDP